MWRHHHYEAIVAAYEAQHDQVLTHLIKLTISILMNSKHATSVSVNATTVMNIQN